MGWMGGEVWMDGRTNNTGRGMGCWVGDGLRDAMRCDGMMTAVPFSFLYFVAAAAAPDAAVGGIRALVLVHKTQLDKPPGRCAACKNP